MRPPARRLFSPGFVLALALASIASLIGAPANAQTAYCWIDAATGQQVTSLVPIGVTQEELYRLQVRGGDINHANGGGGRTYVLVRCPPPAQPVQAAPSPLVPLLPNVGIGIGIGIGHGEDRPDRH
jgi:hypothetical protein